jgi:hypothetical protein
MKVVTFSFFESIAEASPTRLSSLKKSTEQANKLVYG